MENYSLNQVEEHVESGDNESHIASTENDQFLREEKPEIVPLHVSCSQRPDWTCGPCRAYGTKRPWELV